MPSIDDLVGALALEPDGPDRATADRHMADRYTAGNVEAGPGVIFGGQLMAQAIVAGLAGQDGKRVKTLHTIFARGGRPDAPVEIVV